MQRFNQKFGVRNKFEQFKKNDNNKYDWIVSYIDFICGFSVSILIEIRMTTLWDGEINGVRKNGVTPEATTERTGIKKLLDRTYIKKNVTSYSNYQD